jgi:hypothetical protein
MILHTTEVTPLPGYRLFLRFNNGEAGEVDLSAEIDGEVFEALRMILPCSPRPVSIR